MKINNFILAPLLLETKLLCYQNIWFGIKDYKLLNKEDEECRKSILIKKKAVIPACPESNSFAFDL